MDIVAAMSGRDEKLAVRSGQSNYIFRKDGTCSTARYSNHRPWLEVTRDYQHQAASTCSAMISSGKSFHKHENHTVSLGERFVVDARSYREIPRKIKKKKELKEGERKCPTCNCGDVTNFGVNFTCIVCDTSNRAHAHHL